MFELDGSDPIYESQTLLSFFILQNRRYTRNRIRMLEEILQQNHGQPYPQCRQRAYLMDGVLTSWDCKHSC